MPQLNQWNPWTAKSANVEYSHRPAGTGSGEWKVAAELDGKILGQNSSYDMDALIEGSMQKLEVKEPDSNSFRSGRNGRDALRPVKSKLTTLLHFFAELSAVDVIPDSLKPLLVELSGLSPDELAEKTLVKLEQMCRDLHILSKKLVATMPTFPMFDCFTGERTEVKADVLYSTALCAGKSEVDLRKLMGDEWYTNTKTYTAYLTHPYIETPNRIRDDLNALRRIFAGYIMVFVHKDRGYYLMDSPETKVTFQRITLGNPRFHTNI